MNLTKDKLVLSTPSPRGKIRSHADPGMAEKGPERDGVKADIDRLKDQKVWIKEVLEQG